MLAIIRTSLILVSDHFYKSFCTHNGNFTTVIYRLSVLRRGVAYTCKFTPKMSLKTNQLDRFIFSIFQGESPRYTRAVCQDLRNPRISLKTMRHFYFFFSKIYFDFQQNDNKQWKSIIHFEKPELKKKATDGSKTVQQLFPFTFIFSFRFFKFIFLVSSIPVTGASSVSSICCRRFLCVSC